MLRPPKYSVNRSLANCLAMRAGEMASAGHAFFRSENGVWLVDAVPTAFLEGLAAC